MSVVKRAVSFDPEVWAELASVAEQRRTPISTLVNSALRHELRIHRGLQATAKWEEQNGAFTDEELALADRILDQAGVGRPDGADAA